MAALDLGRLAGIAGKGEISLSDDVINRVLTAELGRSTGPVSGAVVETRDDDILAIRIELRGPRFIPVPQIFAKIDQQPRLPDSTVLGLQWSLAGLGRVGVLAAPVLKYLNALPDGIRADGDRVLIDLRALAEKHGLSQYFSQARRLEIHSRQGALLVQGEFRIT